MEPMPFSLDGEARFIGVQNRESQQLLLNGFPQLLEPGGRFLNDIVDASLTDGSVQPFLEQLNKPGRKKELHRMEVGDQRTDALPYWTWCVTSGENSAYSSRPQQGHDFTSASC
nr:hypothetical protein [Parageobacillus thermoglucosidasius]